MLQHNLVRMSGLVRDALRMVRAASSGDELDVRSINLAGTGAMLLQKSA